MAILFHLWWSTRDSRHPGGISFLIEFLACSWRLTRDSQHPGESSSIFEHISDRVLTTHLRNTTFRWIIKTFWSYLQHRSSDGDSKGTNEVWAWWQITHSRLYSDWLMTFSFYSELLLAMRIMFEAFTNLEEGWTNGNNECNKSPAVTNETNWPAVTNEINWPAITNELAGNNEWSNWPAIVNEDKLAGNNELR